MPNALPNGSSAKRLFCFGLGYCALELVRSLAAQGWQVAGTVRSAEKARLLTEDPRHGPLEVFPFDRGHPLQDAAAALTGTTHLLSSVPPGSAGDPVIEAHFEDIAALPELRWVGYLSTTGVYGDRDGGWVDETSALQPTGERGQRRVEAERDWLRLHEDRGLAVHLFRLAGIYGPGRSQFRSLRDGKSRRIDKPGQVFSRIHVDDIVQVLDASMQRPNPGTAYNLCDDEAANPAEVTAYAAALLEIEPPPLIPFEEAELSEMGRSFYRDSKRVSNSRIKQDLGVTLRYPTYREGFRAVLEAETRAAEVQAST